MSERLKQKTAVVTGAGSGIGSAIASLFARQGARVALLDLTTETTEPLINCAGVNVFRDALALTDDDWQRCINVNLQGPYNLIRSVLPGMLKRHYGNIVNVASVHGHKIIPGAFPYPVAKHGLIGLTRSLGVEYASQGIRINSISPGLIMTPAAEAWLASCPDPAAERQRQQNLLPCKRIGEPDEVAYTALFLASDEARFINATDIVIDGGRSQVYHD
ncbi:MAG: SDR family oxidoreductase [Pantoea sp.]|nr:SDR family oxidoreductase [Pantoea sp.]